jgi:aspartyl-tRNA(Asn)/glutamyl-tRNA(Gln) amidotransferase subunit B
MNAWADPRYALEGRTQEYRYFPEPDLPPLIVSAEFIRRARGAAVAGARRQEFVTQYGLSFSDASRLTSERSLADYYERTVEVSGARGPRQTGFDQSCCASWKRRIAASASPSSA